MASQNTGDDVPLVFQDAHQCLDHMDAAGDAENHNTSTNDEDNKVHDDISDDDDDDEFYRTV